MVKLGVNVLQIAEAKKNMQIYLIAAMSLIHNRHSLKKVKLVISKTILSQLN